MVHILIIALAGILFLHDALPPLGLSAHVFGDEAARTVLVLSLVPQAGLAALTHVWLWRCGRRIDRTGSPVYLASADAALAMSRFATVAWHGAAVLLLGWLDLVRALLGDLILVDEAVATLPPLIVITLGWFSYAPIDARLRHARLFTAIESGRTIYPERTTGQYVIDQLRHQALLILVPIAMLLAWGEAVARYGEPVLRRLGVGGTETVAGASLLAAVQVAGALGIFLLAPTVMRHVWSTIPLGPGPLRDRLLEMCRRHGVTQRGLLVWRTHGAMINGAVMGLIGRLRYILLTDALLDSLPDEQVEAVMAHEIAHVRRRHLPWLMGSLLASLGLIMAAWTHAASWVVTRSGMPETLQGLALWASDLTAVAAAFGGGLAAFGWVSRRFEWQADAFAAQHLSGMGRSATPGLRIAPEAAEAMIGALQSVATLNMIPRRKRSWRHGSIAERQSRLVSIIGMPVDGLPIDRMARRIKGAVGAALFVLALLVAYEAHLAMGQPA